MPFEGDVDEYMALLTDRSWGPADTRTVALPEIEYGICPMDIIDLNEVTRVEPAAALRAGRVAEVARAHAGRRSRWQLQRPVVTPELAAALRASGYQHTATRLLSRAPESRAPGENTGPYRGLEVLDLAALRAWHGVRVASGRTRQVPGDEALRAELALRERSGGRFRHVLVWRGDQPVSAGGLILFPDSGAAILWGGGTAPEAAHQGAYRALIRTRLSILARLGFQRAYSVAIEGRSARALARAGFRDLYPFESWERPALVEEAAGGY